MPRSFPSLPLRPGRSARSASPLKTPGCLRMKKPRHQGLQPPHRCFSLSLPLGSSRTPACSAKLVFCTAARACLKTIFQQCRDSLCIMTIYSATLQDFYPRILFSCSQERLDRSAVSWSIFAGNQKIIGNYFWCRALRSPRPHLFGCLSPHMHLQAPSSNPQHVMYM